MVSERALLISNTVFWSVATLQNTVFEINSALSDTMNMVFTYSYHTREYEDFADYDHSVSVVPYSMGPITSNIFYDKSKGNMSGAAAPDILPLDLS